jgi:protein SCO1/2
MRGPVLRLLAIGVAAFALAVTVVALLFPEARRERSGQSSGIAAIGGPFVLTDAQGKRRSDADFRGRHMLVFFGFTHCPDFCPTALYTISQAMERLGDKGQRVAPVFITLDPDRDTPAQLARFAGNFDGRITMLTGSAEEIAAAAREYRVYYRKKPLEPQGEYTIDHSTYIYLMGPDGRFVTHFRHAIAADDLADALRRYL